MKKVQVFVFVCSIVAASLLIGCGGGGGGGGDAGTPVVGPVTGGTTTTGTGGTSSTPGGGTGAGTTITGISTLPSAFSSTAFPASTNTVTIPATAKNRALILVNNGATSANVSVGAGTSAGFAAAVQEKAVAETAINPALYRAIYSDKAHAFHQQLRDFEKRLPLPTNGGLANRLPQAGIRLADTQGQQTTFSVYLGSGIAPRSVKATLQVRATLPSGSGWVNFYLDNDVSYTTSVQNFINALKNAWDLIYPANRKYFGVEPPSGFNGVLDTDITVLISPEIDTAGFFYSGDLYAPTQITGGITNQRKMFYLQYDPTNIPTDVLASTMAHEFQHMINYYQRKLNKVEEEDWLNEAMSGYAEHINEYKASTNNQSKALQINKFFAAISSLRLNEVPWEGENANYGQVYLFGVWLAQQFGNSGSMASMLNSNKVGTAAVAALAGDSFDKVFAQWMVALYANEYGGSSRYGYADINLRGTMHYSGNLRDVTLTGPVVSSNNGLYPYNSGTITIEPYTSAYVELTGTTASPVVVTLPSGISTFELHN